MKRIAPIFLAIALAACTKEVPAPKPDIAYEGLTVVSAGIESLLLGNSGTRTWEEGAAIGMFGSEAGYNEKWLLRSADASLSEALFYGPLVSGDAVAAYYPYSEGGSGSASAMSTELAGSQQFISENGPAEQFLLYCPRAFAFLENGKLSFEYPFGLLEVKIALQETLAVNSISCRSASLPIAGAARLDRSGCTITPGTGDGIVLDCGGQESRSSEGICPFYIVLAPGSYADLTISIDIEGEDAPILCAPGSLTVPRISAAEFSLASVTIGTDSPEGFDTVNVRFDE